MISFLPSPDSHLLPQLLSHRVVTRISSTFRQKKKEDL
nr:MAG TPA: hypothetical protein [Bacteriophage sp.]